MRPETSRSDKPATHRVATILLAPLSRSTSDYTSRTAVVHHRGESHADLRSRESPHQPPRLLSKHKNLRKRGFDLWMQYKCCLDCGKRKPRRRALLPQALRIGGDPAPEPSTFRIQSCTSDYCIIVGNSTLMFTFGGVAELWSWR